MTEQPESTRVRYLRIAGWLVTIVICVAVAAGGWLLISNIHHG